MGRDTAGRSTSPYTSGATEILLDEVSVSLLKDARDNAIARADEVTVEYVSDVTQVRLDDGGVDTIYGSDVLTRP
ncbi:hypothetical protein, partial [Streptomyces mobaraensis]|uniref:hypothetical protein n=1 Tax=Streptomyces mobaraensis TaxID=35621 RepID=UPI001CCBAF50